MTTDPRQPPPEHGLPPDEFLSDEPLHAEQTPPQPPALPPEAPPIEPITPSEVLLPGFDAAVEERPRIAEFGRYARPAVRGGPTPEDERPFWNPYVFAGIAVTGAILLAIVVVFFFGSSGASTTSSNDDGNGASSGTAVPGRGLKVKVISPATMRTGPGRDYDAISELARNQEVEVYGRNNDDSWFAVYYPPGSDLSGWVPGSAIKLPTDLAGLPVVAITPISRPTVVIPTTPPEPTQTASVTPTPTGTGTAVVAPDISVSVQGGCVTGRSVVLLLTNAPRSVPIEGRTVRVVVTEAGAVVKTLDASVSLAPGQQLPLDTGYAPRGVGVVVVTANFEGAPQDANPGNNTTQCTPGAPTATPPATTIIPTIPPRSPTP